MMMSWLAVIAFVSAIQESAAGRSVLHNVTVENEIVERFLGDMLNGGRRLGQYDELNDLFNGVKFGANPGPCPFENECFGYAQNMPQYVKNLKIQLIREQTFGETISAGYFTIWDLSFLDFRVNTLTIDSALGPNTGSAANPKIETMAVDLDMTNLKATMRGQTRFNNMVMNVRTPSWFIFGPKYVTITLSGSAGLVLDGNNEGISLSLGTTFYSTNFLQQTPKSFNFLSGENGCKLQLKGMSLASLGIQGLPGWLSDGLLRPIINLILTAIIEGMACGFIVQAAYYDFPSTNQPGPGNLEIDKFKTWIQGFVNQGLRGDTHFRAEEIALLSDTEIAAWTDKDTAVNFITNGQFESISVAINDFLGAVNENGVLRLNTIMNQLLPVGANGYYEIVDLKDSSNSISLDEYPSIVADNPFTKNKFLLKGFKVGGLNTFKPDGFKLLSNAFTTGGFKYNYTLKNEIALDMIDAQLTIRLEMAAGEWVTEGKSKRKNFDFVVGLKLPNVRAVATTFALVQLDPLFGLKLGQLVGDKREPGDAVNCAWPVMDYLHFSGLQAQTGPLEDMRLENFIGLQDIAQDAIDLVNNAFTPTLRKEMPYLLENLVRPDLNVILRDLFLANPPVCTDYVFPIGDADVTLYYDFQSSLFTAFLEDVLNKVLGGEEITMGNDINSLIDTGLQYFVKTRINNDPEAVYHFERTELGSWRVIEDVNFVVKGAAGTFETSLTITGPQILNLHSIHRLVFQATGVSSLNVQLSIGDGNVYNKTKDGVTVGTEYRGPIKLRLPIKFLSVKEAQVDADEDFAVALTIALTMTSDLTAKINKQHLFDTIIGNFLNPSCVLAILDEKGMDDLQFGVSSYLFQLESVGNNGQMASQANSAFSGTRIGDALEAWNIELVSQTQGTVEHMINFVLDKFQTTVKDVFNKDFDPPYTVEECLTQASPFEGTALNVPFPTLNLGAINDFLNEGTQEQPPVRGEDPFWENPNITDKVYDITAEQNQYVEVLSSVITVKNVKATLIGLANSTVNPEFPSMLDPIIRALELEDDDSVTLRLGPELLTDTTTLVDENAVEGLIPGLSITLRDIVITNVEKIASLSLLQPYISNTGVRGRYSTNNDMTYAGPLNVSFGVDISVSNEFLGPVAPEDVALLRDYIEVSLELSTVELHTILALAVNETQLQKMPLGELLYFDETDFLFGIREDGWNCTIRELIAENGLLLPMFELSVGTVNGPTTRIGGDILAPASVEVINAFVDLMVGTLINYIPSITQGPIRGYAQDAIDVILSNAQNTSTCGVQYPSEDVNFINLDTSLFSRNTKEFITKDLMNSASPLYINGLLDKWVNGFEFAMTTYFDDDAIPQYNGIDLGRTTFKLGGVRVERIGCDEQAGEPCAKVSTLQVLDNTAEGYGAAKPYSTRSELKMDDAFRLSFQVEYMFDGLFGENNVVENTLRLSVTMQDLHMVLGILTRLDIRAVLNLKAGNLLNLYYTPSETPCLFSIFDLEGVKPEMFSLNVTGLDFTVDCPGKCTSPMFEGLDLVGGAATPASVQKSLTDAFNGIIKTANSLASSSDAQQYLNLLISNAKTECVGIDFGYEAPEIPEFVNAAGKMALIGLAVPIGGLFAMLLLVPRHKKRQNDVMMIAFQRLDDGKIESKGEQLRLIEQRLKSLFQHPSVPTGLKFGIPIALFTSMIIFLFANLWTNGATVELKLTVAGDTTKNLPLIEFDLGSSINDMWNAGTYMLGVIIFLASGLWPHTKILLLLFSWFAPPTIMSHTRRNSLMEILDSLGKWSLIDAFVLIMLQVAFRFYITSTAISSLAFIPENFVIVDVLVRPEASIFLFIIATMLSLIINHIMIYVHHNVMDIDEALEDKVNEHVAIEPMKKKKPLHGHLFMVPDYRGVLYSFSPGTKLGVGALLSISAILILVGTFLPILTFEFKGIAGIAIGIIDPGLGSVTHSAFSIGGAVSKGIPPEDVGTIIGVTFMQIIYYVFTLVSPIALLCLYAVMWFVPMTLADQKKLLFTTEIVSAWEALIVLVVSCVAATFQISQLAQFIVLNATGSLCGLVTAPLQALGVPQEDALCFDVYAYLEPTGFVIIFGLITMMICSHVMYNLIKAAIIDRELRDKNKLETLGKCPSKPEKKTCSSVLLNLSVKPASRIRPANNNPAMDLATVNPTFRNSFDSESFENVNV